MLNHKRGSALLTALFIMTLVAIAATAMSTKLQLDIYRTNLTIRTDKIYLASQVATFWSMSHLRVKKINYLSKDPSGAIAEFPPNLKNMYPNVQLSGTLYDLQARFNINNLLDKKFRAHFLRLLTERLNKSTPAQRKRLIEATTAWIQEYAPGKGLDKLTAIYLKQKPPYLPGNQPMKLISEFRLVEGVDTMVYQRLLPYVTVLPEQTAININTASAPVLMTLGNSLQESQVSDLMRLRGEKGVDDKKGLDLLLQQLDVPADQVTLESTYFLSEVHATLDDLHLTVFTVLKRNVDENKKIKISVITSTLNTM